MVFKGKYFLYSLFCILIALPFNLSAQFTPAQIGQLKSWYAADSVSHVSNAVGTLYDKSGNGYHAVQTNVAFKPSLVNNQLNNQPVIKFDGVNDYLDIPDAALPSHDHTIFFIARTVNNSLNKTILARAFTTSGFFIKINATLDYTINNSALYSISAVNDTSYRVFQLDYSNTTREIKTNSNSNGIINSTCCNPSINYSTNDASSIGALKGVSGNTAWFLDGDIAEIIIYDTTLSLSDKQAVQQYLYQKYSPNFDLGSNIVSSTFCPIVLAPNSGFTDYLWSDGSTNDTLIVNQSGVYTVQAKGPFGNFVYDTIIISFPIIQTPVLTNICSGTFVTWNTNLTFPNTFLWSTGATTPAINISTPGNYWVQVTDSLGCTRNSDTLAFTMDNYANTATLGNDTSLCSGNTIGLKIGAAQTANYLWQNGATTATIPITSSGTYSVQATNINGCIVYDTIVVTVSGTAPTALFIAPNACQQTNVSFTNQSIGVAGDPVVSWSWNFGDGATSILQNPTHSYGNSGNYVVQIDVLSAGGCGASFTDSIKIYKKPVATFGTFGFCSDSTTNFVDMTIFGDTSLAAFAWDFGQPGLGTLNNSNVQNPTRNFPNSGIFPIAYTVTDNHGCIDDTLVQLTIFKTPEPSFTVTEVCEGQTMSFLNTSVYDPNSVMSWNFGDGTSSGMLNPMKTYTGIGDRIVQLTVTTPNGCVGTNKTPITVHPFPVASMNIGGKCIGTYVQLTNTSTIVLDSISSVFWVINQNDTISGNTAQFFIPNVNQQQAVIHVTSNFGCKSIQSQFITATQTLNADFTMNSPIVATGTTTVFQNTTVGGNTYNWNFGDGNSSVEMSPSHMYSTALNDSTIAVTLIAESSTGCLDTLIRTINLKSSRLDLEIGNVFYQPDGKFAVIGVELKNKGTVVIQSADLLLSTEKGLQFKETWLGTIQPNEKIIYVFQSKPFYQVSYEDNLQGFYCVDAQTILPNIEELDLTNNRFCKAIEGKSAILMTVYPNPIIQDMEINLLISEKAEVELGLYDMNGRRIQQIFNKDTFEKGLFNYQISMSNVESGTYFLRMISNGELTLQRIAVVH